jgi:glycosyltransferase involved in cell wall biosynthesis
VPRILFVRSRGASFIELDRDLLSERFEVRDLHQPGRNANPFSVLRAVRSCDVVVGWWASWHTLWPITLAWMLRRPSVLIVGGIDTANLPEIGYGYQRGGMQKWASRWIMHRAGILATNSHYSQDEIERNIGIPADRVTVMYHGVPDPFGALPPGEREPIALTVGAVDRRNLERKGLRPFVAAAAQLPDVDFVLAGKWVDDAVDELRRIAPANVRLTGWIGDEELLDLYRRASVYVQASQHEGFGVSVAEAMLAGCIPVVTASGALPEVVDDAGVSVDGAAPEQLAAGVREALAMDASTRVRARERVLREFSVEDRRRALYEVVERALSR